MQERECKNCNSTFIGNYCSNCGQKVINDRFTIKNFFHVFLDAFNVEKGFVYTLIMLFKNPGRIVNDYLSGKTRTYMNPLKYFIIIAGISAIFMVWFKIVDANVDNTNELLGVDDEALQLAKVMTEIFKDYMNIIIILMIPFSALVSKWYFNRHKLYYAEHLIIVTYIGAQSAVISICIFPLYMIFNALYDYIYVVAFLNIAIYHTYGFKKVFKANLFKSFFGALIINYVGQLLFLISFLLLFFVFIKILELFGVSLKALLM